jgi:hypothetical protein
VARRKAKIELTLFPFLSVLAGLIAVLMLFMIVILSTRVIGDDDVKAQAPVPKIEVGREGEEDGIDAEDYKRLERRIEDLTNKLDDRLREQEELDTKISQLDELVTAKKWELATSAQGGRRKGVALGQPTPVNVIPSKDRPTNKTAILIEVQAASYIVHPEKTSYSVIRRRTEGELEPPSPDLLKYLVDLNRKGKTSYPVLLVHPNGAEAFVNLREYLKKNTQLDMGWEPYAREWLLQPSP